jgi:hypothetical protein
MAAALFGLYLPPALFAHLEPHFDRLGALAGGPLDELASISDKHPPTLSVRNRRGADESRVIKHPAYVEMERIAYCDLGLAAMSHRPGVLGWPQVMPAPAKYALTYLLVQAEFGLCCPVSMTDSLARTLRRYGDPQLVERCLPLLTALDFDALHQGAMFMTEQGAGSDVASTATLAHQRPDASWALQGDKWFCSNPDAGFAMVLARSESPDTHPGLKGVSLFLLPRTLPDGTPNTYRILRLKDKLGTRSMASGEIRLEGATAWLVGERGRELEPVGEHQGVDERLHPDLAVRPGEHLGRRGAVGLQRRQGRGQQRVPDRLLDTGRARTASLQRQAHGRHPVVHPGQLDLRAPGGHRQPHPLDHPGRPVPERRGMDAVQHQQVSDQLVAEHAVEERTQHRQLDRA